MKKKLLITCIAILMVFNTFSINSLAAMSNNYHSHFEYNTKQTRRDKIEYQYKVIDNVLYKRLYNYSKNIPLSDWEICE